MRRSIFKSLIASGVGAALCVYALLAGGVSPLVPLVLQWGAELLSTSSKNYSKDYSDNVQKLLLAMYAQKADQAVPGYGIANVPAPTGYGAPPQQYGNPAAYSPSPGQYAAQAGEQAPYGAPPQYGQPQYGAATGPQYGNPQGLGGQYAGSPQSGNPAGAGMPQIQAAYGAGAALVLDAAILAQRASDRAGYRTDPVPIQDGDILRDGGADPRQGDALKFSFRVNCECFVYVIGVDATGYVARVFPDHASGHANPVRSQQQYLVPGGNSWYGLDQVKGIEQVFFVASRGPRSDIESSLAQLAQTSRSSVSRSYRVVRKATLPNRATRGLVKMEMGTPSTVQSESGQPYSFTPQAFGTQVGDDSIVVARWFNHQ